MTVRRTCTPPDDVAEVADDAWPLHPVDLCLPLTVDWLGRGHVLTRPRRTGGTPGLCTARSSWTQCSLATTRRTAYDSASRRCVSSASSGYRPAGSRECLRSEHLPSPAILGDRPTSARGITWLAGGQTQHKVNRAITMRGKCCGLASAARPGAEGSRMEQEGQYHRR
jgi:hypothetical protein